jgi:hypothetical protein
MEDTELETNIQETELVKLQHQLDDCAIGNCDNRIFAFEQQNLGALRLDLKQLEHQKFVKSCLQLNYCPKKREYFVYFLSEKSKFSSEVLSLMKNKKS